MSPREEQLVVDKQKLVAVLKNYCNQRLSIFSS